MGLSSTEKIILLVGILIRLALAPITFHSDIWAYTIIGYFFTYDGVVNIYDHLRNLPQNHPLFSGFGVTDLFIYLPLAYFTVGILMKIFQPFQNQGLIEMAMGSPGEAINQNSIFLHSFLAKFPYLIFDLGIAFILRSLFSDPKKKNLAFALWMFNPVVIYGTFMIGQTSDIPQVFLVVLALFLAFKKKNVLSLTSLGLAASYKIFPLFLIPIAALTLAKDFKNRSKLLFAGFGTFLFVVLPFSFSPAFREIVFGSAASQKLFFMKLPLTGAEGIYIFIFLYTLILLYTFSRRFTRNSMWVPFLLVFLTFFSVSHYHPQWFTWITPFLIVLLVVNKGYASLVAFLFALYVFLIFFFESSLTWGLFGPINHSLYNTPSLSQLLPEFIDTAMVKSILRSMFAAIAVYLAIKLLKEKSYDI